MKNLFSQLGFTLIELLVVISVIGVLAVAVLSSINPIEQINKGRDTRTRSDAAQLINAVDRFYATQETYPWNDPNNACGTGNTCTTPPSALTTVEFPQDASMVDVCVPGSSGLGDGMCMVTSGSPGGGWLDGLTATSEVKTGYVARIRGLGDAGPYAIYVYKGLGGVAGTDDTMYACFQPSSQAFKKEAFDICQGVGKGTGVYAAYPPIVQVAACPMVAAGVAGQGVASYPTAGGSELICLP